MSGGRVRNKLLIGGLVVVVVAVLAWVGVGWWHRSHRTGLDAVLHEVPSATERLSFTDWKAVRERLGVGNDTKGAALEKWLNRAYDKDYSATSVISNEGAAMMKYFGFSAANADWEAYAQSGKGAALVLHMDADVDFDKLAKTLKGRGFKEPKSDDGVWNGGPDLLATIDPELTAELQYVVLLSDKHTIVTSDKLAYAGTAAKVVEGHGASLADKVDTTTDMAGKVGNPIAMMMWSRDFACSDLAMSQAGGGDQLRAQQLIADAGKTTPLSGLVMALSANRVLTVAEEFDSGRQARENLRARAALAVGPAVGRGGDTFASDLKLTSSRTKGATVLLRMQPRDSTVFPLSSLYDGPVIFATC